MEGYTLLEYIESDGTQYIDTGFKPNQDTKVVLDFYSSGASSYKCICGARIKNGNDCFAFWIKDDIAHPQIADNLYNKYSFNISTKQRIIYIIDKNVATFGTSSVTMDFSTFQSQYNLYLFNCNQAGTAASDYFVKGKLYSCRIYDNGTLVRDYTPVMNSGGVYGLYDKVNGVFYSSATSTGFTGKAMGDNGLPVGYSECEYVESNGSQYVDTGVGAVYNMELDIQFFARSNRSLMGNSTEAGCYFGMTIDGKYELGTVVSSHSGLERRTISVESTSSAMNLTAEGETITRAKSTMPTENLKLFGGNADSSLNKYMCSARVFGCQIYVGNEMVRDFVPCCSDAGVYGLYDKVNNMFYSSATDYGFTGKWAENKTLNVSMSEYRHRMLNLIPKTGLPKGYFRCEYIESDGTNYIDTGFKPDQDTGLSMDVHVIEGGTGFLFGSRVNSSANSASHSFSMAQISGASLRSDYGSVESSIAISPLQRLSVEKDKNVTTVNGTSVTAAEQSLSPDYPIYLLAVNTKGGASLFTRARIYSCQIFDNGEKVRDYVPCVSPEGYFGLYDLVTDEFYGFVKSEPSRSYTVNRTLMGLWSAGGFTNPDSSKYDGYMSELSLGNDYGYDIMRITINGYDEFTCYIRSYAESSFDYTIIGNLDVELDGGMNADSSGVTAHTKGNQNGGTDINSYTKVVYTGIGGGTHFIDVMYRKDGSANVGDDRGYLLIDKTTVSSGRTIQVIGRGKVILPSGYTNVEYIASDGNQWIDTGHRPMSENLRVVLDFEYTASYSSKSLYGSQKASSLVFSILPHSGFFLVGSSGSNLLSTSYAVGTRYLLDAHADNGNFSVSLDGSLRTTTYTKPLYKDNTLFLFASHNGTKAAEMSSLKMYFLQIHDNGAFTKFFIPCKKDGVFGLFEMFEGIFYSSEGSSEFTGESDGDNEGSGGDDVVTISFTINGVSYQAEEGMIWYDWCNSSYNDGSFECFGLQYEVLVKGSNTRLYDSSLQYGQDIIREGRVYEYFT